MGWISVKDRLPEDGQKILVLIWSTDIFPATYLRVKHGIGHAWIPEVDCIDAASDMGGRSNINNPAFEGDITHWMPLPDPPNA